MQRKLTVYSLILLSFVFIGSIKPVSSPSTPQENMVLDKKVNAFFKRHRRSWRDMNVPEKDGKILYDLIVKNSYRSALEIGTSTGHSAIWIAWGLSKTGGKLVTVEIDEYRYREALANFKEAGLSEVIDARLADAHTLVPKLEGPFDFVFIDADKHWYTNYARAVVPKLKSGGCIAAHNIEEGRGRGGGYQTEYLEYMRSLPEFETSVSRESDAGLAVSTKQAPSE